MKLIDLTRINQLIDGLLDKINEKYATKAELNSGLKGKAEVNHGMHLTLGNTQNNAYRGDYGNAAYQHSQADHAPSDAQKNSDITKAEIEAKLTGTITSHSHTISDATTSASGLMSKEDKVKLNSIDSKANSIDVYTKAELDKILEELPSNSESVMSFTKDITNAQWVKEDNLYKVKIKHNLSANNVFVSVIDKDSGENTLSTFKIVDVNNIEIYSSYSFDATISILNTKVNIVEEDSNSNVDINDEVVSEDSTWSSKKIKENITMNDGTTVKDAINANKTSILNNANIANQALEKANEAFQLGVNAKESVVQAINSKKTVPKVTNENNWESLSQSIRNIKEGSGNAVASDVLAGKTFTNNDGVEYTGTMVNRGGATTVTPTTSNQTKAAGYYSGAITIKGDANLVASNILSGKSIFGVAGNAKAGYYATGTAISGTSWSSYSTESDASVTNTYNGYSLSVSGLSFTPSVVIVYEAGSNYTANISCLWDNRTLVCHSACKTSTDSGQYPYLMKKTNVMGIQTNGFKTIVASKSKTYNWIAYKV